MEKTLNSLDTFIISIGLGALMLWAGVPVWFGIIAIIAIAAVIEWFVEKYS